MIGVVKFMNKPKNVHDYLEFYFKEMARLPLEIKIYYIDNNDHCISIMKDDTKRISEGSVRLRERPWSNFLFYFIEKKEYEKVVYYNSGFR